MHVLFSLMAVVTWAQEAAPPTPEQQAAEKVLVDLSDFYAGLKSFKADVHASCDLRFPQRKNSFRTDYFLAVRRPNQMALILKRSEVDGKPAYDGKTLLREERAFALDLICDGKDVFYYFSPARREDVQNARLRSPDQSGPLSYPVTRFKAPSELDGLEANRIRTEWQLGLIHRNILALVQKRSEKTLAELRKIGPLRDQGIDEVNSVKCRHLALEFSIHFPQGERKSKHVWQWWIEDGPQKKLLKESMDDSVGEGSSVSEMITYANWALDEPLSDADFALPPGVENAPSKK
jgi:hypothetical protein